jgi:hypothetical protein
MLIGKSRAKLTEALTPRTVAFPAILRIKTCPGNDSLTCLYTGRRRYPPFLLLPDEKEQTAKSKAQKGQTPVFSALHYFFASDNNGVSPKSWR